MLTDEDKKDVIDNITSYSLEEIEAKLSIICRRKKVSFTVEEQEIQAPTTFSLESAETGIDEKPAWLRAVDRNMKNK